VASGRPACDDGGVTPPLTVASTDGVRVVVHDLGGDGPPVLLCHPTGFHGRAWRPVAAELADVAHGFGPDLRGHGDTPPPAGGDMHWRGVAEDVVAVAEHLGLSGAGAAGHSMGGAALLMAELLRPGTFARLWLYEPIVVPRPEGSPVTGPNSLAVGARRRRRTFPSRDAAYANYAGKPPMASFAPEALRAYVDFGFRDRPGGDVELKCAPEVEGATFENGPTAGVFERLGDVGTEVVVAAGGDGGMPAQLAPMVAGALPRGRLERHEDLSHFGPQEAPAAVAAAIRAALDLGA
jgi:pimeloyl-ACP methyl ester carboxylesterase